METEKQIEGQEIVNKAETINLNFTNMKNSYLKKISDAVIFDVEVVINQFIAEVEELEGKLSEAEKKIEKLESKISFSIISSKSMLSS